MKKIFLIFGMAGYLSLFTCINNASALGENPVVIVNYTCPEGCELKEFTYGNHSGNPTVLIRCVQHVITPDGVEHNYICDNPTLSFAHNGDILNLDNVVITEFIKTSDKTNTKIKKTRPVSARSAETPRMVKKIVYEQIVEEDEE